MARRIVRTLTRRGRLDDEGYVVDDALAQDEPLLASAARASIHQRDTNGQRLARVGTERRTHGRDKDRPGQPDNTPTADVAGFSMHAGVAVHGNDRKRLEHVLRYAFRPAVVDERLSVRDDGKIVVQNKTRWRDGTTHVVMTPDQFMQRLVALVPAPRANLTRYHGVFAANHRLRAKVVPGPGPKQLALAGADGADGIGWEQAPGTAAGGGRADRYDWSSLLRRVFEVDVTVCPDCGGHM